MELEEFVHQQNLEPYRKLRVELPAVGSSRMTLMKLLAEEDAGEAARPQDISFEVIGFAPARSRLGRPPKSTFCATGPPFAAVRFKKLEEQMFGVPGWKARMMRRKSMGY